MNEPDEVLRRQSLRMMQIIAGALLMGVLVFLGIVLYLVFVQGNQPAAGQPNRLPIVSFIAAAQFAICVPLAFIPDAF